MLLEMRDFPAGSEGQAYWYHLDGRGSMAGLTKHQGQSTAYGQVLPAQGNWMDPHNHYTFLGKKWDEHLGLYEFGVRLYDPWVGVWLTREPLPGRAWEPRTWHRYQYAFASPISYYDPYGLAVIPGDGGGGLLLPTPQPVPTPAPLQAPAPTGAQWTEQCTTLPPIVMFMWQEMRTNAQSKTAQMILILNLTRRFSQILQRFSWMPVIPLKSAEVAGTMGAYTLWAWMVRQGGPWDPKPIIYSKFGAFNCLPDGYCYYYDVWGNVMYGYLGAATGFSESELLSGAGLEQIGSDIGYTLKFKDPSRLPHIRIPEATGFAKFDHPHDRIGIQIGIELWKKYGLDLTPEALLQAIIEKGEQLEREPMGKDLKP